MKICQHHSLHLYRKIVHVFNLVQLVYKLAWAECTETVEKICELFRGILSCAQTVAQLYLNYQTDRSILGYAKYSDMSDMTGIIGA